MLMDKPPCWIGYGQLQKPTYPQEASLATKPTYATQSKYKDYVAAENRLRPAYEGVVTVGIVITVICSAGSLLSLAE
jgi:hypothetical protein